MNKIKLVNDFKARTYQQSIFANSIDKNSLVVLPTGMGKTIIAIMLVCYYFNKTGKKILFLAPTKPLVEQQEKSFKSFFENFKDFNFQVLTGLVSPKKREELYKENDFIFSTPQLIENDIINRIIDPQDFSLVVFDEAHRATGNYAYTFIAEQFAKKSKILALTASPGTNKETIQEVMDNLLIEYLEVKKNTDSDVKPYVKQTKIEKVEVELNSKFEQIKLLLDTCFSKRVQILKDLGFLEKKYSNQITKTDLLDLQKFLRVEITSGDADESIWKAISIAAGLMKLQYGQELFESQEVSAAHTYFYNFFRAGGDKSKAAEDLTRDLDFREAYESISKLVKDGIEHPKLTKLKEIVNKEVLKNKDLKIIIFNQYRDSAEKIVKELSKIKPFQFIEKAPNGTKSEVTVEIKPALFVGQAKKGEVKLSQKEQKKILQDFRDHKYNIIVSTSVGEEGLDIPKVDLVIFYEPIPSAIRSIQRIGRTGRFKEGRAIILITKGTRDVITSYISNAKERKMYKVLDDLKKEFSKKSQKGLTSFLKETVSKNPEIKVKEEIKTIIFDFGGVLSKFGYLQDALCEDEVKKNEWLKFVKKDLNNSFVGKDLDLFFKKSADFFNQDFKEHKIKVLEKWLEPNLEVLNILKDLKKYKLIILSNNGKGIIKEFIKRNKLANVFEEIFDSSQIGISKKSSEIYKKVLKEANLKPSNCLFIDDNKDFIDNFEKLGIKGILFKDSIQLKKDLISLNILKENKKVIYVDNRENNDLLKELFNLEDIKVEAKKLDIGDIVITEKIAIERKAKKDFVNSIIDKRLFPQLIDLAKNYQRPILILEGEENIFSIRQLNPNVIRATLSAIAVDLRIPIIYTNNMKETAQMTQTITKRANKKTKKEISLVTNKTSFSENQELEKFISSIPSINVMNSKKLLSFFGSIKKLVNSNEDKLQKVEGIGKGRAKNLIDFFSRSYK